VASNWRSERTLRDYLVENRIVAISDIDTRALTRQLRSGGVMRGVIGTGSGLDPKALVERARAIPPMEGSDLVSGVTTTTAFDWTQEDPDEFGITPARRAKRRLKIAAYDFGMKWNIMRRLSAHGCDVRVYPAKTPASSCSPRTLTACF
jgi:carbamoyl-phosphate synthase small subunit